MDLDVAAENKVVLSGRETLTMETLSAAVAALKARGVPDRATLTASAGLRSGSGWSIVAKWEPAPGIVIPPEYLKDPEPDEPLEPCGICGDAILRGAGDAGWIHKNEAEGGVYAHYARKGRPALDVPPLESCGKCGKEMVKDGAMPSGYRHLSKLADKHPATKGRPVRDAPQA